MAEAFLTGFGANLATEFVKSIFGTIKRQIFYVFKHKKYINDLSDQVQELNRIRQRVQLGVDQAGRQGEVICDDVSEWLKDVEQFVEQEANPITGKGDQVGTCSLITRYKVGRKAVKAAEAAFSLLGKGFSSVSYRPALQRTESMYVDRDYEAFDSRESLLLEIMEALKDASANRIGVYGMGGVGKTTLVKKVAWQAKEDNLFDDVVMVDVTEKPDYKKIQETIAFDLGLEFEQHENEVVRACRIRNRLKKGKRVLVILDNIWATPDLDLIGIPLGKKHENGINACEKDYKGINDDQRLYKILLTSRRQDVLCNDMNTNKNFYVDTLSDEDAWDLFWKIVGNLVEKICFRTVAEEIVGKCGGLPLAVKTIANALKNKDLCAWEDALGKLKASNPKAIPEMYKKLFSVVELSFNLLESDEAKSLFLLISLHDVGYGMSYNYLLRYGMGLGLFQDVYTLEEGRKRVVTLLNYLKASCLLLENHTSPWARMHEVVHTVAVSIASTSKLMFNIQDVLDLNRVLEEKISKNATAVSLPRREICQLPERLECPKLELFFLFMKSHSLKIPNSFFEGVRELKVIDMDSVNLMSVPSSFSYLTNLRTLCLDECLLGDISVIGELKNLEILSFSRSNLKQLPREIGQLTRLQLLDLSKCSSLEVIPANVISRLSRLEELDMDNSFVQWGDGLSNRDEDNANLAELNQLSRMTTLRICIPNAQIIPPILFIQQLKRFRILIGDVWNWSYRIEASRTMKLKLNNFSYLGYKLIKRLLKITEDLFLDELNGVQNVLYELDEEGFPKLEYLHVQNCPELLYIVNSAGQIPYDAFLMLEALFLNNLVNLQKICRGPLKEASFNKLKTVKVNKCDELKHLFSISMAKCLSQLQEIEVTDCKNLQTIFAEDDNGQLNEENETNNKIQFTKLRSLSLKFLPQFVSFSFNVKTPLVSQTEIIAEDDLEDFKMLFNKRVEFPSLENLILSSVNIEKISLVGTSCHALKSLTVEGCSSLKFLFSSSMVKSLIQLQNLEIWKCESMEEVIDPKGLERETTISFPKLLNLYLKDLRKLTRFGTGTSIKFPLLKFLRIENCPNLRTFFSNATCGIERNELEEMNSQQNMQSLFDEKVGLPSLMSLILVNLDNLRKIWDDQLSWDSFCKLHSFILAFCNNLLNIFPSSMLGRLHTLHHLAIMRCDSLEEIFEFQAINGRKTHAIMATQLSVLLLDYLPKLGHVWNMNAQEILAFENITTIRVSYCFLLKNLFPASIAKGFLKLEELEISHCFMNEIVEKEERAVEEAIIPQRFKFPQLSSVKFTSMPGLETYYPERHISEWPALKKIKVCDCSNIKILSLELQSHQQEESQLDHLQALFFVDKVAFPNLEELEVSSMDMLLHLWAGNSQPSRVFQNLETLKVSKCQNLKNLVPSTVPLHNLQTLEVSECDKLINLVTLPTARSLVKVMRVDIADCRMIEEIITQERDEAINDDDRIVFSQLNYLRLHGLPSLTSFCSQSYAIELPQLEQVIIEKCTMMKMFCPGVLRTPKLHKVLSTEEDEDQRHWQDNLNTTTQLFFEELVGFRGIESLKLSECPQLKEIWHHQLPFSVFCNLRSLEVDECAHLSHAISTNLLLSLNNLKDLYVRNCDSVEEVFDLEKLNDNGHPEVLPQLSHLYLINLPRLKHLSRSNHEILSFQNLKFLEVQDCCKLRYIFTLPMIFFLKHLQEMKISNCVTMEVIIINEAEKDAADEIVLPMLKSIILESLPEMTSFYSGTNIAESSSLKTITTNDCTKMEVNYKNFETLFDEKVGCPTLEGLKLSSISIEKIWPEQISSMAAYCQTVEHLTLEDCSGLKFLFTSSMVKNFVQLRDLKVRKCESMEEVIGTKTLRGEERISFPKLCFLELKDLPKLTRFGIGKIVDFPSLNQLQVSNCPNLMTLFSNSTCETAGNGMNSKQNFQPLFSETVSVPNLEKLEIYKMDTLRKIWDDRLTLNSFWKLKELRIEDCCELKNIFPSIMLGRMQTLESFITSNCESLEEIFEIQAVDFGRTDAIVVGQLREIHLYKLPKLKHAWNLDAQGILSFKNLHSIKVHNCDNLKFLFPASIARCLLQLRELEIISCMVKEIVDKEDVTIETVPKFVFSQLTSLLLKELPVLESFYPGIHISEWPVLNVLEVHRCDVVKIFASEFQNLCLVDEIVSPALEKIFSRFQYLTEMRLDGCENLKYLFTDSVVESLVQLECLHISNCNFMEGIIVRENERISDRLFPKLFKLYLVDLPKLKRFCNFTSASMELLSLALLLISNCPNMETFVSNAACANMTRNESEEMISKAHSDTQPLFDEKVSLPNLEVLIVGKASKLQKIWNDYQLYLGSFSKLHTMGVRHCNQLLHIFPSIMHGRLQRLQLLKVWNCDSLEEILQHQALSGRDEIVFKELNHLELVCLPRLASFCLGNCTLKFPSLNKVFVGKCSKMENFSHGILRTPNLQRVQLTDGEFEEENEEAYEERWEGDLNTTIQHIFKEMNAQTSEEN